MVDPSSGRATLLESIRQAGGIGKAKLRSVKERKLEKKKQKEQEQGEAGPAAGGRSARVSRACAGHPGVCGPLLPSGGACLDLANCPRKQGLGIFLDGDLAVSHFSRPLEAPGYVSCVSSADRCHVWAQSGQALWGPSPESSPLCC